MPAFTWSALTEEAIDPEHSAATGAVCRGERIEAIRVRYAVGSVVREHADPREQVHAIVRGAARYRVADEERVVRPGEAVLIRSGVPFGMRALEELEVLAFREVAPRAAAGSGSGGEAFFDWERLRSDLITPAYSSGRGPTISGERIEVAKMFYPAGTEAKAHAHPNEQIQVVLGGRVEAFVAGDTHVIRAGDGIRFPPNAEHGLRILEDYTLFNCKDIVPGWSVYHAKWER